MDPLKCPRCNASVDVAALVFRRPQSEAWFTICAVCGREFDVDQVDSSTGNPERSGGAPGR